MKKQVSYILSLCIGCMLAMLCSNARAANQNYCDSIIKTGVEAMFNKQYTKALSLLNEAKNLSADNHWYHQHFLSLNNIGLVYYFLEDYGEAQTNYLEAYTIAVKEADATHEMTVLNNIAILYGKEKNYTQAYDYFKKAYDLAKEKNLLSKLGSYALNLGIVCNETGNLRQGRDYLEESKRNSQGNTKRLLEANTTLAANDMLEGNARDAINASERLLKQARDSGYKEDETALLTLLAKAWIKNNDAAKAAPYAHEALTKSESIDDAVSIYEILATAYTKTKAYDLALKYKDSVMLMRDSADKVKNSRLFENSRIKFELLNSQHELALNQSKLSNQRKIFYSVLTLALVIIAFIIWVLRNKAIKHKQKELIAERSRKIIELEFEKEKNEHLLLEKQLQEKETIALLEQERLKNEIEVRNRKLSAKALYLSGRNELIEEIIASLAKLPGIDEDTRLANHISSLKNHLKANNEWDSFSEHFEEVNQGFLSALKTRHPNLTANDTRFLSYVYMNLNTKEIASALNITVEGCRKRKERLIKKMQLPGETGLYEYLSGL